MHFKSLTEAIETETPTGRAVIFIHGCFWHQHPDPACKDARQPKSNADYWQPKLERNQARDAEHEAALQAQGWRVLAIWEC